MSKKAKQQQDKPSSDCDVCLTCTLRRAIKEWHDKHAERHIDGGVIMDAGHVLNTLGVIACHLLAPIPESDQRKGAVAGFALALAKGVETCHATGNFPPVLVDEDDVVPAVKH
jgi:hypothetical protein